MDLSKLNGPQRDAVLHDKGPLLILAGAGSGKTRVITHRIAYLIHERGVNPYNIMAITFTNKAAEEMKERVARLVEGGSGAVWVSTFHSSCAKILRRWADKIGFKTNFSIYDSDDSKTVVKNAMKELNIDPKQFKPAFFMRGISNAKNECMDPEEFARHAYSYEDKMVLKVYRLYQDKLIENNAMDFDDLLLNTVMLFDKCEEALECYRSRFKYIMVDEYQDTNAAQFKFIKQLACHRDEDDGKIYHNLCVVGDDDQSIYRFRGADITNILSFESTFPDAKVIKLEQNYRSTRQILEAANAVISNNNGRKNKKLWTEVTDGEPVEFAQFNNDFDEAAGILADIKGKMREHSELDYGNFAILYRTNSQSRVLEERMILTNTPYRVVGGVNFYSRLEIKDVLAYLKILDNPDDAVQIRRVINVPKRGIGDTTLEKIEYYSAETGLPYFDAMQQAAADGKLGRSAGKVQEFIQLVEGLREDALTFKVSELIDHIINTTGYDDYIAEYDDEPEKTADRRQNISALVDKAVVYEDAAGDEATLNGFLNDVSLVADIDSMEDGENKIRLMTLHSAKGLEFDYVYMAGMEENLFPSMMSLDEDPNAEEERRLCYVGITRARKFLMMTAAKERMMRGEWTHNNVSRFVVKEIPRYMLKFKEHGRESFMHGKSAGGYGSSRSYGGASTGSYGGSSGGYGSSRNYGDSSNSYESSRSSGFGDYGGTGAGRESYGAKKTIGSSYTNPYAKKETPAVSSFGPLGYNVGDKVSHPRFGVGTVNAITDSDKGKLVTVEFNGVTRKMLANFAKLTKI